MKLQLKGDEALCAALQDEKADIFRLLAADELRKAADEVSTEERERMKRIVYAIVYGVGPEALSQQLDCTVGHAKTYMAGFLRRFAGIKSFQARTIAAARTLGFVATASGRRRHFPALLPASSNASAVCLGARGGGREEGEIITRKKNFKYQ